MELSDIYRREYGVVIAVLSKKFGPHLFDAIEDAVQTTLVKAIENWQVNGLPQNPRAWLIRVATNLLLDSIKHNAYIDGSQDPSELELKSSSVSDGSKYQSEIQDEQLALLFLGCDPRIPEESQLVFVLKTVCGFSVAEISHRLFLSEANVYKRYTRAKAVFLKSDFSDIAMTQAWYESRLTLVLKILYLMFNEGYLSLLPDAPLRSEFSHEAMRLVQGLLEHPTGGDPQVSALYALMLFHVARDNARVDEQGALIPLDQQDRSLWDSRLIQTGLQFLTRSAQGNHYSRYHGEANIAAVHSMASSFEQTNWREIVSSYDLLESSSPSPLNILNKAIALSEWKGPQAGLDLLLEKTPPSWLEGYFWWSAVLADLYAQKGERSQAMQYLEKSIELCPNAVIAEAIEKRVKRALG